MKIAQIAPLIESCPPRLYGGTERIVSYLTEELVRQGHDVTLVRERRLPAPRLVWSPSATARCGSIPEVKDPIPHHIVMLEKVRAHRGPVRRPAFSCRCAALPLPARAFIDKTVTTLHGRLDLEELKPLYAMYSQAPLVSISIRSAPPMPPVNWVGNVHHGLPPTCCRSTARREGGYLAFLGRISQEKRPDRAIEIAARAGVAAQDRRKDRSR